MTDNASKDRTDRLRQRTTHLEPTRECDVVMKGGITSGVLYPLAVCELASTYRLRNVGGTSAGAIAAAAAAAAEYGRRSTAPGSGFDALAELPDWLGADDHLVNLFQPPDRTRALHSLLMKAVRPGSSRLRLFATGVSMGLRSRRWWLPLLGAVPGAVITAALILGDASSILTWLGLTVAALITVVGLVVGATVAVALSAGESLAGNMYGVVAGSEESDGRVSLSDWLTEKIDSLAGIAPDRHPLTFGDLWAGPSAPHGDRTSPAINLEMLTTNVTQGRPHRLPYELGSWFAFQEADFRRIFPKRVVDYLIECAGDAREPGGLVPLPPAEQLPVVVATRMSLSFPLLISAVPLYAVDHSLPPEDQHLEPCWFSDGGITSNFPVSFFDALLPSRPTFGINLRPFHPSYARSPDEHRNVWLPRTNSSGVLEWWTRWSTTPGLGSVWGFLRAIADTMQNWVDTQQTRVPGYRDRIVHISHADDEGGMNLAMPPETLRRLSERGRCAGARLVDYYTTPPGQPVGDSEDPGDQPRVVSWENHRWIRMRTSLALVANTIEDLEAGFTTDYASDLSGPIEAAPSYPFTNLDQQALARALMLGRSESPEQARVTLPAGLLQLATAIEDVKARGSNVPLDVGSPRPAPVLRIAPGMRVRSSRGRDGESRAVPEVP